MNSLLKGALSLQLVCCCEPHSHCSLSTDALLAHNCLAFREANCLVGGSVQHSCWVKLTGQCLAAWSWQNSAVQSSQPMHVRPVLVMALLNGHNNTSCWAECCKVMGTEQGSGSGTVKNGVGTVENGHREASEQGSYRVTELPTGVTELRNGSHFRVVASESPQILKNSSKLGRQGQERRKKLRKRSKTDRFGSKTDGSAQKPTDRADFGQKQVGCSVEGRL